MPARERNPAIPPLGALNLCFLSLNRGVGFLILEGLEPPFLQVDSDEAILAALWTINTDGDAISSLLSHFRVQTSIFELLHEEQNESFSYHVETSRYQSYPKLGQMMTFLASLFHDFDEAYHFHA